MSSKRFRIAFSFAGEQRDFVSKVVNILAKRFGEEAILYDKYHTAEFSRSDLAFYLPDLYHHQSDLIVVVLCPDYDKKEWCGLEWNAIFGRLKEQNVAEVMLTRFGRVEGKGLQGLAGYTDLDDETPETTATLILERLALNEGHPKNHYTASSKSSPKPSILQDSDSDQRKTKVPASNWYESLALIQRQFEAKASQSRGLYHLLVEVSDDERSRVTGPEWFPFSGANTKKSCIGDPWDLKNAGGLPGIHPGYREIKPGESVEQYNDDEVIRDQSGVPRAIKVPPRLRFGYLCGDCSQLDGFESLAKATSRILTGEPELHNHPLADDLCDLFRKPREGVRYVFGEVPSQPNKFGTNDWSTGVLPFQNGVLIDVPIAESFPGMGHWLLFLHRLSWRKLKGCPLRGSRMAWKGFESVPYEWVFDKGNQQQLPDPIQKIAGNISGKSFYSVLGEEKSPMDVNLASVFAIQQILSTIESHKSTT